MSDLEDQRPGVSRRTVAKAMAWSVPAVALAVPAPAYAASGGGPTVQIGQAFKLPGASCANKLNFPTLDSDKAYLFVIRVTNTSSKTIVIESVAVTSDTTLTFAVVGTIPALPATLAPGEPVTIGVYTNSNDSANLVFNATVTVEWGHPPLPDPDNHTAIVQTAFIPGTPTPASEGYNGNEGCTPPFVPLN